MNIEIKRDLTDIINISKEDVEFFNKNGYIKLKNILSPDTIRYMNETISSEVKRLNTQHLHMDQRDTYGKAFLQIMNIWTKSDAVKNISFSKKLASIASQLLEVSGVRMYHDQALFKEPSGGHTPWHADQYYWPLSSDRTVTVWIPLQATPLELGPLEFSQGSQLLTVGRDKKISDESEALLAKTLRINDFPHIVEPFDTGEVSYHMGWLYHRAGPNTTDKMRGVMTVIYMDKDIKLKQPENENQIADWNTWCPGVTVGEVVDSELNPILFEI
jgi:ectoine hydroxylase-related dioxygenase (phytanoyl-CoA dioxygenase family)